MTDNKYAFFIGCLIPYRELAYEISARRIAKELGIKLITMPDANCCGLPIDPVNHEMSIALAARNLCIAEDMGLNIITLCNGCFATLTKTNKKMKKDRELRQRVNKYLADIGLEFKGSIEVKHFIEVLTEDVGIEKLSELVTKPFNDLKVAEHYGCHFLRPHKYLETENPESPVMLTKLIELTGATVVDYLDESECCGGTVLGIDPNIPLSLARDKLKNIKEAGAEAMITICPMCHMVYDLNQPRIEKTFSETYGLPVLHYPQLLGLAMGITPEELALDELRVKADKILSRLVEEIKVKH